MVKKMKSPRDLFFENYWGYNLEENEQTVELAAEAIWDLAEHFDISPSGRAWSNLNPPRVREIESRGCFYIPIEYAGPNSHSLILIGKYCNERLDSLIGHEVGHFMHHLTNPKKYELLTQKRKRKPYNVADILIEGVAFYSELTFVHRNKSRSVNPLRNSDFTLAELARLDFKEALSIQDNLYKFFRLVKRYAEHLNKRARVA